MDFYWLLPILYIVFFFDSTDSIQKKNILLKILLRKVGITYGKTIYNPPHRDI